MPGVFPSSEAHFSSEANVMRNIIQGSISYAGAAFMLLGGLAHSARATNLTQDGDFNAQTIGSTVGTPYAFVSGGGDTVTAGAQSPFTNVFANNGKGVNTPAGGSFSNPYFVSSNSTSPETGGTVGAAPLYFNTDFENVANDGDAGGYDFEITNSASHAQRQTRPIPGQSSARTAV
jgi:hypothetical protein